MKIPSKDNHLGLYHALIIILPYIFITGILQLTGAYLIDYDIMAQPRVAKTEFQSLIIQACTTIGSVITVVLMLQNKSIKSFIAVGFQNIALIKDLMLGLLTGFIIMLVGFLTLYFTNQIHYESYDFDTIKLLISFVTFVLVALSEELLCRGFMLNNLMKSYNKYVALVLSSALFSLIHIANPYISTLNLIGLFVAGLLLGISYIYTGRLWFPIALHFSWNFFQGSIFGFNVSGINNYSLINTHLSSSNLWNGGDFGFEGSILSVVFQIIAIYFVARHYQQEPSSL